MAASANSRYVKNARDFHIHEDALNGFIVPKLYYFHTAENSEHHGVNEPTKF